MNKAKWTKKTINIWFIGQSYFNNDGAQLHLIFQPISKTISTYFNHPDIISKWESKGLSNEKFWPPFTRNKGLSPKLVWCNSRIKFTLKGSCLKQEDKASFTPKHVVNLFIVYELNSWPQDLGTDFTLRGCLFGCVKVIKNADLDKYSYSGYGTGFDTCIEYSLPDCSIGKNVIILGANMSSSGHIDNKGKDILILCKGPPQRLDDIMLRAETQYSINFTRPGIKFCAKPAL